MSTTSNIIGLQGTPEPPADTIRKLIHDAWQTIQSADNTVPDIQIISQGGVNHTNTPVTQGDAADISQQQGGTYCVITDGRREAAGDTNDSSYYAQEVIIHVYGDWPPAVQGATDSAALARRLIAVIDDAILIHRTGPYPKSSDGLNSGISHIRDRTIEWEPVPVATDTADVRTVMWEGAIYVMYQRAATYTA